MPISPEQLAAWKALADAATAGPWVRKEYYENTVDQHLEAYAIQLQAGMLDGPDRVWPAVDHVIADDGTICIAGNGPTSRQNGDFVAAAREAMPALIAEVERLQLGTTKARIALELAKKALADTVARLGGYDWNADPLMVTHIQGEAAGAILDALATLRPLTGHLGNATTTATGTITSSDTLRITLNGAKDLRVPQVFERNSRGELIPVRGMDTDAASA